MTVALWFSPMADPKTRAPSLAPVQARPPRAVQRSPAVADTAASARDDEHVFRMLASQATEPVQAKAATDHGAAGDRGESVLVIPGPALRFSNGDRPAVALWRCEGQLTSLRWQPEGDGEVYPHALATAYDPDALPGLRAALASTSSFDDLVAALAASGLRVEGS